MTYDVTEASEVSAAMTIDLTKIRNRNDAVEAVTRLMGAPKVVGFQVHDNTVDALLSRAIREAPFRMQQTDITGGGRRITYRRGDREVGLLLRDRTGARSVVYGPALLGEGRGRAVLYCSRSLRQAMEWAGRHL